MFKFNEKLMCSSAFTPSDLCYHQAQNESGRSMVEMLGVLAVIGVLSVAGVAGFKTAMEKHRANELLSEASRRAVIIAAQRQMGQTPSVADFENVLPYGTFSNDVKVDDTNGGFELTVSGVDKNICQHMKNITSTNPQINGDCDGSSDLKFVYKNDLSAVDFVFTDTPDENSDSNVYYYCDSGCVKRHDPQATEAYCFTSCDCTNGATADLWQPLCVESANGAYCSNDMNLYFCTSGVCASVGLNCPCPGFWTEDYSSHICTMSTPSSDCGIHEECYTCHNGVVWDCDSEECRDWEEPCDCEGVWGFSPVYYKLCPQKLSPSSGYLCIDNRVYSLDGYEEPMRCACTTDAIGPNPGDVCDYGLKFVCRDGEHVDRYENGILIPDGGCNYTCQTGEVREPHEDPWCWR